MGDGTPLEETGDSAPLWRWGTEPRWRKPGHRSTGAQEEEHRSTGTQPASTGTQSASTGAQDQKFIFHFCNLKKY